MALQVLNRDADFGQKLLPVSVFVPQDAIASGGQDEAYALVPPLGVKYRVVKAYCSINEGVNAAVADADVTLYKADGSSAFDETSDTAVTGAFSTDAATEHQPGAFSIVGGADVVDADEFLYAHKSGDGADSEFPDMTILLLIVVEPDY